MITPFPRSGGSIGIGFAIPINTAKRTMQEILRGEGQKPWIELQREKYKAKVTVGKR